MTRYETRVEEDTVYVNGTDEEIEVGDVEQIVDLVGGYAWEITYTDWELERYQDMDTSDEGLIVDVVDMMEAMTHGEAFVGTLRACPTDVPTDKDDEIPPRVGLFAGKLMENLETGLA